MVGVHEQKCWKLFYRLQEASVLIIWICFTDLQIISWSGPNLQNVSISSRITVLFYLYVMVYMMAVYDRIFH